MVKWAGCSPSTLTIQVQIPLKPTVLCLKRTKIKKKRLGLTHFFKRVIIMINSNSYFYMILFVGCCINIKCMIYGCRLSFGGLTEEIFTT